MTLYEVLQKQIDKIYGIQDGKKTGSVLIPAFLGDFRKVLEKSDLGVTISEEYMTEDKKMHLVFRGQRRIAGYMYQLLTAYIIAFFICLYNSPDSC